MDYQFYQQPTRNDRHSRRMETWSIVMGIISLSMLCMVYPSIICGALGIVFALLSRGGEIQLSNRAKAGLTMSISALAMVVFFFIYTIVFANLYYGGLENMLRESCEMMGLDYDVLFGQP